MLTGAVPDDADLRAHANAHARLSFCMSPGGVPDDAYTVRAHACTRNRAYASGPHGQRQRAWGQRVLLGDDSRMMGCAHCSSSLTYGSGMMGCLDSGVCQ